MDTDAPDPTDRPLRSVIDDLERGRGSGQFRAVEGGHIECLTCHQTSPAAAQRDHDLARIEGASDPDDQAGVVMVRCPHCAREGSLVLRYGPDATPEDGDVLKALS